MAPRSAVLDRVFEALTLAWRAQGGNPDVAGELPGLLEQAGLDVIEIRPNVRIGRPGSPIWCWIERVLESSMPKLVDLGFVTPAHAEAFRREWAERSGDGTSYFCSPPLIDIVARKNG